MISFLTDLLSSNILIDRLVSLVMLVIDKVGASVQSDSVGIPGKIGVNHMMNSNKYGD